MPLYLSWIIPPMTMSHLIVFWFSLPASILSKKTCMNEGFLGMVLVHGHGLNLACQLSNYFDYLSASLRPWFPSGIQQYFSNFFRDPTSRYPRIQYFVTPGSNTNDCHPDQAWPCVDMSPFRCDRIPYAFVPGSSKLCSYLVLVSFPPRDSICYDDIIIF